MIGPATNHKRFNGAPLCGEEQLGYMWDDDHLVSCRACQILMRSMLLPVKVITLMYVLGMWKEDK